MESGEWAGAGGLYSGDDVTLVAPDNQNLAEALHKIIATFPQDITGSNHSVAALPAESGEKEGTIIEKDGVSSKRRTLDYYRPIRRMERGK